MLLGNETVSVWLVTIIGLIAADVGDECTTIISRPRQRQQARISRERMDRNNIQRAPLKKQDNREHFPDAFPLDLFGLEKNTFPTRAVGASFPSRPA
jgi:hypothetical protein